MRSLGSSAAGCGACPGPACLEGLGLPASPAVHAHRRVPCGLSGLAARVCMRRPECGCAGPPLGAPMDPALPSSLTDQACSCPRVSLGVLLSYPGPLGSRLRPPSWW